MRSSKATQYINFSIFFAAAIVTIASISLTLYIFFRIQQFSPGYNLNEFWGEQLGHTAYNIMGAGGAFLVAFGLFFSFISTSQLLKQQRKEHEYGEFDDQLSIISSAICDLTVFISLHVEEWVSDQPSGVDSSEVKSLKRVSELVLATASAGGRVSPNLCHQLIETYEIARSSADGGNSFIDDLIESGFTIIDHGRSSNPKNVERINIGITSSSAFDLILDFIYKVDRAVSEEFESEEVSNRQARFSKSNEVRLAVVLHSIICQNSTDDPTFYISISNKLVDAGRVFFSENPYLGDRWTTKKNLAEFI